MPNGAKSALSRIADVGSETMRLVLAFLDARAHHRGAEPPLLKAWDEFFKACDPYIRKVARQRSGTLVDPQDRVQEIWRVVILHLDQFDPWRGSLRSWLTTVVRHALVDQDRCSQRVRRMETGIDDELLIADPDPVRYSEVSQAQGGGDSRPGKAPSRRFGG